MGKMTLRDIKDALASLPEELDRVYDKVLQRIEDQEKSHGACALQILSWILLAARPLKSLEIQNALAVRLGDSTFDESGIPEIDDLLVVCAGIVTIRENNTLSFVHYTAKEYLDRRRTELFPNAQRDLALVCLTYVAFDDFAQGPCSDDKTFEHRLENYPFLQYASEYWAIHGRGDAEMGIVGPALGFLRNDARLMSSIQVVYSTKIHNPGYSQKYIRGVSSLWFAATFGLSIVTTRLLDEGAFVEAKDTTSQRPLHQASMKGFTDIVSQLLDRNAQLDAKGNLGRTPLHWAVVNGNLHTAQLLISRGASVGAQADRRWTALHLAASNGHAALTAILLTRSSDIDGRDSYGGTPLYRAAESGDVVSARLLIDSGAKLDVMNQFNQSALHRAADVGHMAVAQLLLKSGANFKSKDNYGYTPLYRASEQGHVEIQNLLFQYEQNT